MGLGGMYNEGYVNHCYKRKDAYTLNGYLLDNGVTQLVDTDDVKVCCDAIEWISDRRLLLDTNTSMPFFQSSKAVTLGKNTNGMFQISTRVSDRAPARGILTLGAS